MFSFTEKYLQFWIIAPPCVERTWRLKFEYSSVADHSRPYINNNNIRKIENKPFKPTSQMNKYWALQSCLLIPFLCLHFPFDFFAFFFLSSNWHIVSVLNELYSSQWRNLPLPSIDWESLFSIVFGICSQSVISSLVFIDSWCRLL